MIIFSRISIFHDASSSHPKRKEANKVEVCSWSKRCSFFLRGGKFIVSTGTGVSLRPDEVLLRKEEGYFQFFFPFPLRYSPFFQRFPERERILNFPRNYFDFDVSLTALCPIEKFLSIRRKLFLPVSRRVADYNASHFFSFFCSFSFLRFAFLIILIRAVFKRKRSQYLYEI